MCVYERVFIYALLCLLCSCVCLYVLCSCVWGKSAALKPGAPNFSEGAKIMTEISDASVYTVSLPPPATGALQRQAPTKYNITTYILLEGKWESHVLMTSCVLRF